MQARFKELKGDICLHQDGNVFYLVFNQPKNTFSLDRIQKVNALLD